MDSPSHPNPIFTNFEESPSVLHLFSDLSPLKSVKALHSQSFPLTNLSSPPPVFMSPRCQNSPKSMEMDTADSQYSVQSDSRLQTEIVHNFQEEQILSPSQYLAPDPPDMDGNTKSSDDMPNILKSRRVNINEERTNNSIKSEHFAPQEADQRHNNVSRHLHFGATMSYNRIGNDTHKSSNVSFPEALPQVQITVPYQNEPSRITRSLQAGSPAQSVASLSTSCRAESFEPTQNYIHDRSGRIPSRFGLPFSSITRSLSRDSVITPFKLVGNHNAQEQTERKDLDGVSNSSASVDIYARLQDYQQESQTSPTLGSVNYPIIKMQPPSDSIYLMPYDNLYEVKMLTSPNTDNVEELNKASPKRNRKRAKDVNDGEGCKNCNCKRSKCLKLYCECFAAGVYCLDTCACENCFNRPEYEDTVLDTRQQIETRNPLAFAPKVVNPTTSTPSNIAEEASWTTPSSARHKRGCNCKKSKCLKKYCECYQAGVGCYNGCRCEDCNNCFGRKSESIYRRMEKWESPSREQMDIFEAQTEPGHAHQFPLKWEEFPNINLTPISQDQSKFSHKGSSLQSSITLNHQCSSDSSMPQLLGRKVLSEINSNRIFYNVLEEDPIPGILRNKSTPLKLMESSPNQIRESPPQIRSQDLRSSSSQGSKSVRKLNMPPSPLTPYSQLKAGEPRIGDDIKEN